MTAKGVRMGVTVSTLRSADWRAVEDAAKGWKVLADQAVFARDDITERGAGPLSENWTDPVGAKAGEYLKRLADQYDCAGLLLNSAGMVLNGLANAIELAQDELVTAEEIARKHALTIHDNGSVTYTGADVPEARQAAGHYVDEVRKMVADALEAASQADDLARTQLDRVATATAITDPDHAAEVNNVAAAAQVHLTQYAIPHGQPPEVVAAWWNGLSAEQRRELKLAAPLDLYDLPGVPDDVKRELAGPGPYNRMEMLRYARDHWDDTSIDRYDNNCTTFVSHAIQHGGAGEYNEDDWLLWDSDSDWYQPGEYPTDSKAWSQAQANHDFLLKHGGQEVTANGVQPGDVVYWRNPDGHIHHAAVVSSVTPDGDIHYTQHSGSMRDGSLDGRISQTERDGGNQQVVYVRPNPNW
ncbi:amidase domain-containing protein [Actinokineospora sp. HUAS TT18]|uniref:amidase domain-containing protein n=1 Tax=Actinokineospora sp. HUAS TT18 TaxID=3447451 RepID=UPI003F51E27D